MKKRLRYQSLRAPGRTMPSARPISAPVRLPRSGGLRSAAGMRGTRTRAWAGSASQLTKTKPLPPLWLLRIYGWKRKVARAWGDVYRFF